MKESEAKYKLCPIFAVAAAVRGMELAGSCKGSACALWRELPAFPEARSPGISSTTAANYDPEPRGVCGLKTLA